MKTQWMLVLGTLALTVTLGCGDDNNTSDLNNSGSNNSNNTQTSNQGNNSNNGPVCAAPSTQLYAFQGLDCADSVSYGGQIARHILIKELSNFIKGTEAKIDGGMWFPAEGEVVSALDFYFRFDYATSAGEPLTLSTTPGALQTTYEPFGADKNLVGKLAGNDTSTDHKDWKTEFQGWSDDSIAGPGQDVSSPEGLVTAWFATFEKAAIDRANGVVAKDPDGNELPLHVTADGRDLQQLIEKFLSVGIGFSQGADDYLDDDIDGKGLLASNAAPEEGKTYTALAHAWDEGFGYFGASRDYPDYTDEEIAGKGGRETHQAGYFDTDGDGKIDLTREYIFGASSNAAKRDFAAAELGAQVDMTGDSWAGFFGGRALIEGTEGELNEAQMAELKGFRDQAVLAWEKAYMATVLHYINETLREISEFGTADFDFVAYAKGWSEAKGFAFAPQFNPKSPMSDADFVALHEALGDKPVLANAEADVIDAYASGLRSARAKIAEIYEFPQGVLGDENGANGW